MADLGEALSAADATLFRLLHGEGPATWLDSLVVWLSGESSIVLLVPLFVAQVRAAVSSWARALLVGGIVLALLGAVDGSATMLKHRFERPRPCQVQPGFRALVACSGSPSLPSNHAANMFALAAFTVTCTRRRPLVWFGIAAAVAYSRVRLGVHYPLDVLAGALWGGALGVAAGVATRWMLGDACVAPTQTPSRRGDACVALPPAGRHERSARSAATPAAPSS